MATSKLSLLMFPKCYFSLMLLIGRLHTLAKYFTIISKIVATIQHILIRPTFKLLKQASYSIYSDIYGKRVRRYLLTPDFFYNKHKQLHNMVSKVLKVYNTENQKVKLSTTGRFSGNG